MSAQPVEWVLVVHYGVSAHRATYGRKVRSKKYSKDYIQLTNAILKTASQLFPAPTGANNSAPLTFRWPLGKSPGAFVFKSADRPHLKWETNHGAPKVWKMSLTANEATEETIPGNPSHVEEEAAENEFKLLSSRGAGQPYLIAVKLRGEPATLHLRAYLDGPKKKYSWADIQIAPPEIQALAKETSQEAASAWSMFDSGGAAPSPAVEAALSQFKVTSVSSVVDTLDADTGRTLAHYLRNPGHGLFFDPTRNHNAWLQPAALPKKVEASIDEILRLLDARFPAIPEGDAAAEKLETDPDEVEDFRNQIKRARFEVPDSRVTAKTRGSAQKAFADAVKSNYGMRCAITGIKTKAFLVAAHIVPWGKDQTIRLDPANGICLSLIVDRAFENGHLLIDDDHTIRIDWDKVGDDEALRKQLVPHDGKKLNAPTKGRPKVEYLQRKRALNTSTKGPS